MKAANVLRPAAIRRIALYAVACAACATLVSGRAQPPAAYDALVDRYVPYLDPTDPFGWPAKVNAIASDEYKFWRGTKDLYYAWCKRHCTDWLADPQSTVLAHGDLHPGNIGSYAASGPIGTMAFGLVDFDDAARLPFQIELLHGFITLRLMAAQHGLDVASAEQTLLNHYRAALTASDQDATTLLASDADAIAMCRPAAGVDYSTAVSDILDASGRFRPVIHNAKGTVTDLLRPVDPDQLNGFAIALAEACATDPQLRVAFTDPSVAGFRKRLRGAALRTRLGSSGSQGLHKYFLWLGDAPLATAGSPRDVVLYLKQQIPAAAERAGISPRGQGSPGMRVRDAMRTVVQPAPALCGAVEIAGRSYWLSLREPWSDELDDSAADVNALETAAGRWGTTAGAAHRAGVGPAAAGQLADRIDAALADTLRSRATSYLAQQREAFAIFKADPRVISARSMFADARDRAVQNATAPAVSSRGR